MKTKSPKTRARTSKPERRIRPKPCKKPFNLKASLKEAYYLQCELYANVEYLLNPEDLSLILRTLVKLKLILHRL